MCASVKEGRCIDPTTKKAWSQKRQYEEGIGSNEKVGSFHRIKAGFFGTGYENIIREVYEECCKLNGSDEIWLYGFSRGAYIARAVAGLLHFVRALVSADGPGFQVEYSRALNVYRNAEKRSQIGPGQVIEARWE